MPPIPSLDWGDFYALELCLRFAADFMQRLCVYPISPKCTSGIRSKKSPHPPSGQVGTYTELSFQYKYEINISNALFMHCPAVCNGRIFSCVSSFPPRCRSPPVNLDFQKNQIDWRYITWMLTKKIMGQRSIHRGNG